MRLVGKGMIPRRSSSESRLATVSWMYPQLQIHASTLTILSIVLQIKRYYQFKVKH
ncbi:unnamed protein product, partial [Timema podura]|nr:unnamed protein product [Timema podura]